MTIRTAGVVAEWYTRLAGDCQGGGSREGSFGSRRRGHSGDRAASHHSGVATSLRDMLFHTFITGYQYCAHCQQRMSRKGWPCLHRVALARRVARIMGRIARREGGRAGTRGREVCVLALLREAMRLRRG